MDFLPLPLPLPPLSLHIRFLECSYNYDDLSVRRKREDLSKREIVFYQTKKSLSAGCPVGLHAACGGDVFWGCTALSAQAADNLLVSWWGSRGPLHAERAPHCRRRCGSLPRSWKCRCVAAGWQGWQRSRQPRWCRCRSWRPRARWWGVGETRHREEARNREASPFLCLQRGLQPAPCPDGTLPIDQGRPRNWPARSYYPLLQLLPLPAALSSQAGWSWEAHHCWCAERKRLP